MVDKIKKEIKNDKKTNVSKSKKNSKRKVMKEDPLFASLKKINLEEKSNNFMIKNKINGIADHIYGSVASNKINQLFSSFYFKEDVTLKLFLKHLEELNPNRQETIHHFSLYRGYKNNPQIGNIENYDELLKYFSKENIDLFLKTLNSNEKTPVKFKNDEGKAINFYLLDLIIFINKLQNKVFKINNDLINIIKSNHSFTEIQKKYKLLTDENFYSPHIGYSHTYKILEENLEMKEINSLIVEEDKERNVLLNPKSIRFPMPSYIIEITLDKEEDLNPNQPLLSKNQKDKTFKIKIYPEIYNDIPFYTASILKN